VKCKGTGKDLYTESDAKGFGGCKHALNFASANKLCSKLGARLCTRKEVAAQCTRGTGCNHDSDLIWTSTNELALSHASCHKVVPASRRVKERERCAADAEKHETRCCSDTYIAGYRKKSCKATGKTGKGKNALWTESDSKGFNGCQHNLDWTAAAALCSSMGARLCTRAEIKGQCTTGTGCNHDSDLIWSKDSTNQDVSVEVRNLDGTKVSNNADNKCAVTLDLHVGNVLVNVVVPTKSANVVMQSRCPVTNLAPVKVPSGCVDYNGCDSNGRGLSPCFNVPGQGPLACTDTKATDMLGAAVKPGYSCASCPTGYQTSGSGEAWECGPDAKSKYTAGLKGTCKGREGCQDIDDCAGNPCGMKKQRDGSVLTCHDVERGNKNARELHRCAPHNEKHEVRCCSDTVIKGFRKKKCNGIDMWTESDGAMGRCAHNKNYAQAVAICSKVKARLCTQDELFSGCTAGTGCGHDADLIWASTTVLNQAGFCKDQFPKPNSFKCTCAAGYTLQGGVCVGKAECTVAERATCDPMAVCQLRGDGTAKIAFDCVCPAGVSTGNGKKKKNRWDRTNGCKDTNKCAGHPKTRKCGVGLNKAWYADSLTPCRDNAAVKELKDKIDFTCPRGCPYGTTDANPKGQFTGRTCRDIDDCRATSTNTVRTLNQCSGGLDTKVYTKIKCVDEGAGMPKCKCDSGQKELHVTRCHDIVPATKGAKELERCAVDEETHEVRCCSDRAIGGWTKKKCNGKDLWTESDGRNFGGCRHRSTWKQANKQCQIRGSRLCTRAEIKAQCTRGTGCGHDADLIWSGTVELKQCHDVAGGNGNAAKEFERCAAHSEVHEVRCCSTKSIAGWAKRRCSGKDLWTESDGKNFGACQHAKTYEDAKNFCGALGARLCTRLELTARCTRGTGCNHDSDLIWASTTATRDCHDVVKASNNAREHQKCAAHNEKHEVRCCSSKYIKGYTRKRCQGRWLWTESNSAGFGGCQHSKTYAQAYSKCASMGARLCSKDEVWNQCTTGTGCNHDSDLLWTSTSELIQGAQCQSACSMAPKLMGDAYNLCMGAVGNAVGQAKVLALCNQVGVGNAAYMTAKSLSAYGVTEADAQTVKAGAVQYFGTSCVKEAAGITKFCPVLSKAMGVSGTETLTARADYGTYGVRCRGRGKVGGSWRRQANYQAVFRFDLTKGMAMSVVVKDNKPMPGSTDKQPATSIAVRSGPAGGNCGLAKETSCSNKKRLTASYQAKGKAESVYFIVNAADRFPITIEYKEWDPNADPNAAACTQSADMSKLSQGKDGYVATLPAASSPPVRPSCGKGASQQVLKMRVPAGSSFSAFLPEKKAGTFIAIRDGSICPGNNEDMCARGQQGTPVHWKNAGTQGSWVYVLVEGPAAAKVKVQWELDSGANSCASPITEADFSSLSGGGSYSHFMKLPTVRALSCPSGSAKRGPEEVFKINVPKDNVLTFRVMQFKSNLPNTNFFKVGMKWGGTCPGNKYVKCQGSLPGDGSKIVWTNDQPAAQDAFVTLVAESRGKRECTPYRSPNTQKYAMRNIPLGADKAVIFSVKAKNDAHIGFFSDKKGLSEVYEIVLSGWGNKKSVIRQKNQGRNEVSISTRGLLDKRRFKDFWADAKGGLVRVGKGITVGQNIMMQWKDPNPHTATYVGFMTGWGATGDWRVCNLQLSNDIVRQSKYISGSYYVDYKLKQSEKAMACDSATALVGNTGRKTEPSLIVGHFNKTYVSGCGANTAPGYKTKLYKVNVPAGKTAQMSLVGTSKGQLMYEGRTDAAGTCPGSKTVFCGTVDGTSRSVNSWYNPSDKAVALYIVVEEPKAAVGSTSGAAKPFQITWDLTKTAPVCNLVPRLDCATSNLFLVSHRGKTLSDNKGVIALAAGTKEDWQAWDLEDAGGGQWFIKSHSGRKLEDRNDKVGLHNDVGAWQKWTITPAGGGKFFITGHRAQRLEDRRNVLGVHQHTGSWQKWTVTTKEDMPPCLSTRKMTPRTYKYFKFNLISVRNNGRANSVQMGEIQLRDDSNKVIPGAVASNPGGRSPGNEQPRHGVDGNTRTKWLDFNKNPLVLTFPGPVTVKDYRWSTANDATNRDPARWTFEGSNDGATWTVLEEKWSKRTFYSWRNRRNRWQSWNSISSKIQDHCSDQTCPDHDKWKSFNGEIENSNFFKTDCCAAGECGSDTVFKFDVPFGAKLTAKVTTQAWMAKYQLKSEGGCSASVKGSPGTKAAAKGACYTSSTANNAGSEMSFYDAGQDDKPQSCHNVARGRGTNGGNAIGGKVGTYACAVDTQKHEVRCCSDKELKNGRRKWVKRPASKCGKDIWTESDLSVGGSKTKCHSDQTWAQADQLCAAQGARLCTLNEITSAGCTSGTGCGHDGDLIWSGDQEIADRSCHDLIKGSSANRRNEIERCAPDYEEHETRCCSDKNIRGMARKRCKAGTNGATKTIWADSSGGKMGGCKHSFTWPEANAFCTASGMRLCTAVEMKADCTRGTGCNHDNDLIWTSTKTLLDAAPGNPPATAVYLTVEGATPKDEGKFKVDYKLTFGTKQTGCSSSSLTDMDKEGSMKMVGTKRQGKLVYYAPQQFTRAYPAVNNFQTTLEHGPVGSNVASIAIPTPPPRPTYRWLRFNLLKRRSSRSNSVQMAELAFYDSNNIKLNPSHSSNPGGRTPGNEGHAKIRDGNSNTKWLDFNKKPIILMFSKNVAPASYKWMTANDANGRDPIRWTIDGTNDGKSWTTIDATYSKRNAPVPGARKRELSFTIPTKGGAPGCLGDTGGRTDALTRYTGHGVVHKLKVLKDYRLMFRIVRHLPTYNFLVAVSSSPIATPTCPGVLKSCLVNNRNRWNNNARKSKNSPYAYYPSSNSGNKVDEYVYITVQAENTAVQTNGYFIDYSVCKKGTSILGKGVVPTSGRNKKKGITYKNRWWNCPRSL